MVDDIPLGPTNVPVLIAQAISGLLSKWNLTMLFAISGGLVLLMTVWMALHSDLKGFSESLSAAQASDPGGPNNL